MKTPDSIEELNQYEVATLIKQIIKDAMANNQADPISQVGQSFSIKIGRGK